MKPDRLIGILSILLQREKVTAPELAEQFEVSHRTVHRDIETLCLSPQPRELAAASPVSYTHLVHYASIAALIDEKM